jgi:hypothetical protein
VKIKITEYLVGATRDEIIGHLSQQPRREGIGIEQLIAMVDNSPGVYWNNSPSGYGQITRRFYTLQRVNGTGPNGKDEGAGRHRHGIEDSDRIKKNSVARWLAKSSKEPPKKASQVSVCILSFRVRMGCSRSLRGVFRHASSTLVRAYPPLLELFQDLDCFYFFLLCI